MSSINIFIFAVVGALCLIAFFPLFFKMRTGKSIKGSSRQSNLFAQKRFYEQKDTEIKESIFVLITMYIAYLISVIRWSWLLDVMLFVFILLCEVFDSIRLGWLKVKPDKIEICYTISCLLETLALVSIVVNVFFLIV